MKYYCPVTVFRFLVASFVLVFLFFSCATAPVSQVPEDTREESSLPETTSSVQEEAEDSTVVADGTEPEQLEPKAVAPDTEDDRRKPANAESDQNANAENTSTDRPMERAPLGDEGVTAQEQDQSPRISILEQLVTPPEETQAKAPLDAPLDTPLPTGPETNQPGAAKDQLPWVSPASETNGAQLTRETPPLAVPKAPEPPTREERIERTIDAIIATLEVPALVGQLFMPAFTLNQDGLPLVELDEPTKQLVRTIQPGGVLLFGQNLQNPDQTRQLTSELQQLSAIPLLIAVDQEGGLVDRLGTTETMRATRIPSAHRVGRTGDEALAYELARVIARELLSLGINTNFAPVADVLTNPDNPVIGTRAFGSDPEMVGNMVAASVQGYSDTGVLSVLKHFPGHGDTMEDSHYSTAVVYHDIDRLREVELLPFNRGIQAGADAVMTAHISLPNVVPNGLPATFSSEVISGLLRAEMNFDGVVFTDSLSMGALVGYGSEPSWPLRAFQAGADVLVRPRLVEDSFQRILEAVQDGTISHERLHESVRRILKAKFRLGLMEPPLINDAALFGRPDRFFSDEYMVGAPGHQKIADEVWIRSQQ